MQQFCYDDFSRLTWAGSTGTPPCTGTAITPGTLTAAQYTQSFSYDNQDRLRSSPLGSYSYDDPHHLHAATYVSSGTDNYSADYDAAGNMTARAPSESLPQQQLSWDNEGRLIAWQNAPSSPTSTAQYLYDGEGNRVEQQVTTGSTSTTTVYVGDLESVATTGGTTTTTTYYYAGRQCIALAVNGTLSYLASDLLSSATVALDGSGTGLPIASQLYAPYGGVRYSNGTMLTDYGFTGQRADGTTGLDYYGARYYDPALGQFTSADTMMDGLNRYGYVGGNPISYTDPSGHQHVEKEDWIFFGDMDAAVDVDTESTVWDDFSVGTDIPITITDGDTQVTIYDSTEVSVTDQHGNEFDETSDDWFAQHGMQTNDFTDEVHTPGRAAAGDEIAAAGRGTGNGEFTEPGRAGWNDEFSQARDDGGTGGGNGGNNNNGNNNGGNGGTGGGNDFSPNPKTVDSQGRLTNGTYTIDPNGMAPHMPGTALPGRSVFLTGVDADSAVLDAAQFADENNLWFGNHNQNATVYVRNGPVGVHANTGELVDWITVSRDSRALVHGWPSQR